MHFTHRDLAGNWTSPQEIFTEQSLRLTFVTGKSGTVYLLREQEARLDYYQVNGSQLIGPELISEDFNLRYGASLIEDRAGILHVVWVTEGAFPKLTYRERSSDGTWSAPMQMYDGWGGAIDIVSNDQGELLVMWLEYYNQHFYIRRDASGVWSSAQKIPISISTTTVRCIEVDSSGFFHVVWYSDEPTNASLVYMGPAQVETSGDAQISQTISLSTTMTTPILSYWYEQRGASTTSGAWFGVQVETISSTVETFPASASTLEWNHECGSI